MLSHTLILTLSDYIFIISVYLLSIALAGYLQACFCSWLGDESAEEEGFATLNPFVHVDLIGLFFLLYTKQCGWGKVLPIHPSRIEPPARIAKLYAAFFSKSMLHLLFSTVSLLTAFIVEYYQAGGVTNSYALVFAKFLLRFSIFNIMLSAVSFIISAFRLALVFAEEKNHPYMQYALYASIIIPALIMVMVGPTLMNIFYRCSLYIAHSSAYALGFCP